jgi:type I site-specific restriction-modification system R (restriction) subunit
LNRTYRGKSDTFVLDFANEADEILESFKPYYRMAQLSDVSDPNLIHDLQAKLDASKIYLASEVEAFVKSYFDSKQKQADLKKLIDPAADRFRDRAKTAREATPKDAAALDELELFRKDVGSFGNSPAKALLDNYSPRRRKLTSSTSKCVGSKLPPLHSLRLSCSGFAGSARASRNSA